MSRFWFGPHGIPRRISAGGITLPGIDYESFKLFHLSVLWRLAIHNKLRNGSVNLKHHYTRLRNIIKSRKAPDPHVYPFWGTILVDDRSNNSICDEIIFYAGHDSIPPHDIYVLVYGGVAWHYVVGDSYNNDLPIQLFSRDGNLRMETHSIHHYQPLLKIMPAVNSASHHNKGE